MNAAAKNNKNAGAQEAMGWKNKAQKQQVKREPSMANKKFGSLTRKGTIPRGMRITMMTDAMSMIHDSNKPKE